MKSESILGVALELIEELNAPGTFPADARVGRFFRARRFLGGRDRRELGALAYAWLRHAPRGRARWDVWAARRQAPALADLTARHGRLARLGEVLALARDGIFPWPFAATLDAARLLRLPQDARARLPDATDAPDAPDASGGTAEGDARADAAAFWDVVVGPAGRDFLAGEDWPQDAIERLAAEVSLPAWLARRLAAERGPEATARLAHSLLEQASLDLRVNLRLTTREAARNSLADQTGAEFEPTSFSPLGLRTMHRVNLTGSAANRKGWIEVADEGSQIVALCLDAQPGMTLIDACAGAGGKTLALADVLLHAVVAEDDTPARTSRIYACDIFEDKLLELERRASEAGVAAHITTAIVGEEGPLPEALPEADIVLVDAPCSGLGTLRRNPDLKYRYGEGDITEFAARQRAILERFAPRVRPGGRLAYVTCSLLAEENEEVAQAFGAAHPEFEPYFSEWARARLPLASLRGHQIFLDPVRTQTDAFYLAQWRRRSSVSPSTEDNA